jgi:hypothetical protein
LVFSLLSTDVHVPISANAAAEPARLNAAQVAKVFTDHVPGVRNFLFREQPGQYCLKFLQIGYRDGLRAFKGTALDEHLKSLLRLIVHHGYDGKPAAARYLTEVAEACMDCQAVQARTIERVGLEILGVTSDLRGLVTSLIGEYKSIAMRMLAAEHIAARVVSDDDTPTHYENRLTADLGARLGLNADDVRLAKLDEHAQSRFRRLQERDAKKYADRCRQLFDLDALLRVFVAEANSFSVDSSKASLPQQFLHWASENLTHKHAVFDIDTCTRVEIDCAFALAVLETLFLGKPASRTEETFHGYPICGLFSQAGQEEAAYPLPSPELDNARADSEDLALPFFSKTVLDNVTAEAVADDRILEIITCVGHAFSHALLSIWEGIFGWSEQAIVKVIDVIGHEVSCVDKRVREIRIRASSCP